MRKLAIISALLAACGSVESSLSPADGGTDATTGTDAAARDAVSDAVVDAGLIPEGVTKIAVTAKGGGPLPPPPDGSTCQPTNVTYTIGLPDRELSWNVCDWGDGGPYFFRNGQKTLTASEYAAIDTAVNALARTTTPACGFDKPTEDVTFTTPSGTVTYYDDFYFCDASDPKPYVKGIDLIIQTIDQYAR